jgi:hypothetical protein
MLTAYLLDIKKFKMERIDEFKIEDRGHRSPM